jgi:hypothetical protein
MRHRQTFGHKTKTLGDARRSIGFGTFSSNDSRVVHSIIRDPSLASCPRNPQVGLKYEQAFRLFPPNYNLVSLLACPKSMIPEKFVHSGAVMIGRCIGILSDFAFSY